MEDDNAYLCRGQVSLFSLLFYQAYFFSLALFFLLVVGLVYILSLFCFVFNFRLCPVLGPHLGVFIK